jgi:hypothetical protein
MPLSRLAKLIFWRGPRAMHCAPPIRLSRHPTGKSLVVPAASVKPVVSMKDASGVDDDGLAGHGLGAAHGDHHVGAVVLVGRLLQERA